MHQTIFSERNLRQKPPPRPRPGQKKFLTSVLSILSKSTTGTQYPDVEERRYTKNGTRTRYNHEADIKADNTYKQSKYKSRVLNRKTNNINDQFIVLQSRKEIAQTPSNYSEANDTQNEKPMKLSIRDILGNHLIAEVIDAKSDLLDETVKKENKIRIKDTPETLASKMVEEGDKKLYNLFVDILESTFNVNDLKGDKLSDSNTALEINESIARKLRIDNKTSIESACINRKERKEEQEEVFEKPIDICMAEHKTLKRVRPRISVKSFIHPKKTDAPETHSYQVKRKYFKNKRKNVLLNIFKEELKLKPNLEEPLTLYQALKVMVKNKKIIRDKTKQLRTSGGFKKSECLLKRRKIINMKMKKDSKVDREKITKKYSDYSTKFRKPEKTHFALSASHHSLEVHEYNFEEPEIPKSIQYKNKYQENENKNNTLVKSQSPFAMHSNYDYYTLLKFPDRSTYHFIY